MFIWNNISRSADKCINFFEYTGIFMIFPLFRGFSYKSFLSIELQLRASHDKFLHEILRRTVLVAWLRGIERKCCHVYLCEHRVVNNRKSLFFYFCSKQCILKLKLRAFLIKWIEIIASFNSKSYQDRSAWPVSLSITQWYFWPIDEIWSRHIIYS